MWNQIGTLIRRIVTFHFMPHDQKTTSAHSHLGVTFSWDIFSMRSSPALCASPWRCGFWNAESGAGDARPGFAFAFYFLCAFYGFYVFRARASGTTEQSLQTSNGWSGRSLDPPLLMLKVMFVGYTTNTEVRFWNINTFLSYQFFEASSMDKSTYFPFFFSSVWQIFSLFLLMLTRQLKLSVRRSNTRQVYNSDVGSQVCSQLQTQHFSKSLLRILRFAKAKYHSSLKDCFISVITDRFKLFLTSFQEILCNVINLLLICGRTGLRTHVAKGWPS